MIWPYTAAVDNALTAPADASIAPFVRPNRLTVRQRKNWTEIITSLDAKNQYEVYDEAGNPVFHVAEARSSFLARLFLRSARPFHSEVRDLTTGQPLLALDRPFRFIFHRLEVRTPDGRLLGALQKRWTWFRRKYTVEGPDGQEVATLFGPFWRPWTFKILVPGRAEPVGMIQKRWSGLLKEAFTDADNFGIEFGEVADPRLRAVLFAATVLIDVVHFEQR